METHTETILGYFEQINAIPRCSQHEARLGQWLSDWAAARQLKHRMDAAGNLVVNIPGSVGMEKAPTVVVQGHMDMVCEKTPDSPHDFSRDPIQATRQGDWLMADRTTLGADNGIALAYALALADHATLRRPPLELLFTVDEETGLNGVKQMAPDLITGNTLINLDSEDEGVFTIGCAGGANTHLSLDLPWAEVPSDRHLYRVVIGGLKGGHSGIDIHKPRGNAIKLLARTLARIQAQIPVRLVALNGGTRHNAIARDAEALMAFRTTDSGRLIQAVDQMQRLLKEGCADEEAGPTLAAAPETGPVDKALTDEATRRALSLLRALPHGVAGMSSLTNGAVETSCNLATAALSDGCLRILSSQRSAHPSRLEEITETVHAVAELAAAAHRDDNHYPPWPPDRESPLLKTAQRVYQDLYGQDPVLQVIHAGLECAIIGASHPGMQMISFGPTIQNPHSPTERLHIPSVEKVWHFLVALLATLGR